MSLLQYLPHIISQEEIISKVKLTGVTVVWDGAFYDTVIDLNMTSPVPSVLVSDHFGDRPVGKFFIPKHIAVYVGNVFCHFFFLSEKDEIDIVSIQKGHPKVIEAIKKLNTQNQYMGESYYLGEYYLHRIAEEDLTENGWNKMDANRYGKVVQPLSHELFVELNANNSIRMYSSSVDTNFWGPCPTAAKLKEAEDMMLYAIHHRANPPGL